MKRNYNYKAFTPEEVNNGFHLDLINYLLDYNKKSDDNYYDIHITTDSYCTIVEWADVSYSEDFWDGRFQFVDEDECIMKEVRLSDGSITHIDKDEDVDTWLKENDGGVIEES